MQAVSQRPREQLAPVDFGACGLSGPVAQPRGHTPAVCVVVEAVAVLVLEDEFGGGLSYSPALDVAEAFLAVGVELPVVGVRGADRSAVRHRIEDGGVGVDELLVVVLGAVAGVQIEAVRQREALDVDAVAFAAVFDLEVARRLPERHQMRRGGQLRSQPLPAPQKTGIRLTRDLRDGRAAPDPPRIRARLW